MSCCNFGRRRHNFRRDFDRFDNKFDHRRGCCEVNWGSCRDNRLCPGWGPSFRGPRRPY